MRNSEFQANDSQIGLRLRRRKVLTLMLLAVGLLARETRAVQSEVAPKKLLSGRQLTEALQERRSLNVTGQDLRDTIQTLRENTAIAICVDRRIDPSSVVNIATDYVTTRQILNALVTTNPDAAFSFGADYVYLGPNIAAVRLRTLSALREQDVQQLRRSMDTDLYRKVVESRDRTWPDLAQPRQLLTDAAATAGLKIANVDLIPHDLWKETRLPKLHFSDFASLILNQFDLTFSLSPEGNVTLVPVPDSVEIEQQHRVGAKKKTEVTERWTAAFPHLNVAWKGSTAVVRATVEIHGQLRALIDGESSEAVAEAPLGERRFTMKVERAAYGSVIQKLRDGGITIRIEGVSEAELPVLLQKSAAFELTDSRGDEFFRKAFLGLGAEVTVKNAEVLLKFP